MPGKKPNSGKTNSGKKPPKLALRCAKCNYKWEIRAAKLPKVCPGCKNPKWHLPKIPGMGRPRKIPLLTD